MDGSGCLDNRYHAHAWANRVTNVKPTINKMKNSIIILGLALISLGVRAQHDHASSAQPSSSKLAEPAFKDRKVGEAYGHYIHLKDALVASDQEAAKTASVALVGALSGIKGGEKAYAEAENTAKATSLAEQRKAFTVLSNELTTLVKGSELTAGELYVTYCPMANSNKGGYWLSNEKEIRNPYFGKMMLKCGSVKETIKK